MSEKIILKIKGMHCISCAINIDGELEDLDGIVRSVTSYAKSQTAVEYDSEKINISKIKKVVEELGYEIYD